MTKILGVMQPYLFPYLGYWQLINAVDEYVVYDDVQHIKRGWINRNALRIGGQRHKFTISLEGASQTKKINEVAVADDFVKLRKTIESAYRKAPQFKYAMPVIESVLSYQDRNLAQFAMYGLKTIGVYLGIETPLIFSSDVAKDPELRAQDKILAICSARGATGYLNAIGGMSLYDREAFAEKGINLRFLKSGLPNYGPENLPGLSIIDLMMWNDRPTLTAMLADYDLV